MRATDGALAIPRLFLLLLLAALFRPTLATTVLLVGGTHVDGRRPPGAGRGALDSRARVRRGRAGCGASRIRVAMRHVLPHAAAVLGVEAALRLGQAVLLEASLSFLGLGVPHRVSSWGGLIADGRDRLAGRLVDRHLARARLGRRRDRRQPGGGRGP